LRAKALPRGENPALLGGETMTDPAPTPAANPAGWLNNQPYLLLSL